MDKRYSERIRSLRQSTQNEMTAVQRVQEAARRYPPVHSISDENDGRPVFCGTAYSKSDLRDPGVESAPVQYLVTRKLAVRRYLPMHSVPLNILGLRWRWGTVDQRGPEA